MKRTARRPQRGQTLLTFALISVVLFALLGLAVDAGVGYENSGALERASAAAALAGVTYMPDGWAPATPCSPAPNPMTVQCEALAIAQANGYVAGGATNIAITVIGVDTAGNDCNPSTQLCAENRLRVRISATVSTSFIRLLGFGSHREVRSAQALYLRPITIGQGGQEVGSDLASLGCNNTTPCNDYFHLRTEGWGVPRDQGDAFTPNPHDGAGAYASDASNCVYPGGGCERNGSSTDYRTNTSDTHSISTTFGTEATYTVSGTPAGFSQAARGGYNFNIYVPKGEQAVVQVYNPSFAPDCNWTGGNPLGYSYNEGDSFGACGGNTYPASGTNYAVKNDYSTMAYTLYQVPDIFQHNRDVSLSTFESFPLDGRGVASSPQQWARVLPGGIGGVQSGSMPSVYHKWIDVGKSNASCVGAADCSLTSFWQNSAANYPLSGGAAGSGKNFRLRVDTLDINGGDPAVSGLDSQAHKGLAVRVLHADGSACTSCIIGALDELAIFTPIKNPSGVGSTSTFSMQMMAVPPEYRGQNVSVYVYDPGDIDFGGLAAGSRSNLISILDPSGAIASSAGNFYNGTSLIYSGFGGFPPQTIADCAPGGTGATIQTQCTTSSGGESGITNIYNGIWARYDVNVPAGYNPGCPSPFPPECVAAQTQSNWYWSMQYRTNGIGNDTVTLSVGFGGTPVHLVGA